MPCPAEKDVSEDPGPPYYWSVTHGAFIKGPKVILGAPTRLQIHQDECRRLLGMRFIDSTWNEDQDKLEAPLLRKENIMKLLENPRLLAKVFGVDCLFEWVGGKGPNFISAKPGMIEWYGFE